MVPVAASCSEAWLSLAGRKLAGRLLADRLLRARCYLLGLLELSW